MVRRPFMSWWRDQWKYFPRNWPLDGEFTGPGEFPTQMPVMRSFDVFFDLRLNKRLSKQPWGWWFETPSWSLWRQCNVHRGPHATFTYYMHMIRVGYVTQRQLISQYIYWLNSYPWFYKDFERMGCVCKAQDSAKHRRRNSWWQPEVEMLHESHEEEE